MNTAKRPPRVGMVIVTYNSVNKLGDFFDSVLTHLEQIDYFHEDLELAIVDNASQDGTWQCVHDKSREFPYKVTTALLKSNVGLPAAYNKGALLLKNCRYIMFMNDDALIKPDVVTKLVNVLEQDHHIAAVNRQ